MLQVKKINIRKLHELLAKTSKQYIQRLQLLLSRQPLWEFLHRTWNKMNIKFYFTKQETGNTNDKYI